MNRKKLSNLPRKLNNNNRRIGAKKKEKKEEQLSGAGLEPHSSWTFVTLNK